MFSEIISNSAWYYFLLAFLFSAALSLWLYQLSKKKDDVSKLALNVMFSLRFISFFLITLLLLNIFLKRMSNETENPLVLLAIDNSKSMVSLQDSDYLKKDFLKELAQFKINVSEKYQVKTVLFGSQSETSEKQIQFDDKETDISELFTALETNYSNQNVGALVLVSDGIYNRGANPLYSSSKQNYPIYSVALGDTSEFRDIGIQKINCNRITYLGNQFPVEVIVNAKKFQDKTIKLGIYEKGVEVAQTKVKITSSNFLSVLNFTLNAEKSGLLNYTVKLDVLEGEKNIRNNAQNFVIEVIEAKEKILLLAKNPHPDINAIKEVLLSSTNYEFDYSLVKDFQKSLKAYNLVILHGYSETETKTLDECKKVGVPFWIIAPQKPTNLPGLVIKGVDAKYNDAEANFVKTFDLFTISDELERFVAQLPAITTFFGTYTLGNSVHVMLNQRIGIVDTENPILFFSESDNVKNSVFIGDGFWRWRMRDFAEHKNHLLTNEFISKCVQYLTVKEDKSFFRVNGPKVVDENQRLVFEAEVYNKSYESVIDPEVHLEILDSDKKKFDYTFGKTERAYKLEVGFLPVGDYTYHATVKQNNDLFKKEGVFVVREVMAEKLNTVANHELLFQISNKSGGSLFKSNELNLLEQELLQNENIKPITYSRKSTNSMIEFEWIFWLILFLLSSEWLFRKRYLSI